MTEYGRRTKLFSNPKVVFGALIAAPFLLLRNAYGLLYYSTNFYILSSDGQYTYYESVWNPITGNLAAFALMGLLPEVLQGLPY